METWAWFLFGRQSNLSWEKSGWKVTGPPTTLVSPPTLGLVHDQFMTESQSLKDGIQLWLSQMHSLQLSQFLMRNSWLIIICAQARRPRRSYGSRCVYQLKPRFEGLSVNLKNAFSYDSFCDEIVPIAVLSERFQIHHENINTKAAVEQDVWSRRTARWNSYVWTEGQNMAL